MTLLIAAAVLVLGVVCVWFLGHLPGSRRRIHTAVRHHWTAVTAITADGVSAHLQVEYAVRVTDPVAAPEDTDALVADEVEDRVRQEISATRARDLPDGGDRLTWAPESFATGVLVEHVVVTGADLAVTPELRRLLDPAPGPAWT